MILPNGHYEEWIAFERRGSVGRWHHVVFDSKQIADDAVVKMMLDDLTIDCIHHSATLPDGDRPESAFHEVAEAAR